MILSFYLGIGFVIVFGLIRTLFADLVTTKAEISAAYLLTSIVMMTLSILAPRVVGAIPMALCAHWLFRVTQVLHSSRYQGTVRLAWCSLGVVPVLLALSVAFFSTSSRTQTVVHLAAMFLLGLLCVELCLFGFQKIPFTCSYLPGKGNLHFVFWATLVVIIRGLKEVATRERSFCLEPPDQSFCFSCSQFPLLSCTESTAFGRVPLS
jgi:hypothetical protein